MAILKKVVLFAVLFHQKCSAFLTVQPLTHSFKDANKKTSAIFSTSYLDYLATYQPYPEDYTHAPMSYFDVKEMESKGARGTADWGTPADATRKLDDDGSFRVGAWYCSEGGWPSPNPKAHTEIFYVLEGHGCLGDADGAKHYFGPGDTVIIPKGHTGRWDVYTPIHKIWAVNDHPNVEEPSFPIRTVVENYHKFAPEHMISANSESIFGAEDKGLTKVIYDVGPTKVGAWTCDKGASFSVPSNNARFFLHILEGTMFLTNAADGSSRRCVPGDTVFLPSDWTGLIDVIDSAKLLWTIGE